MYPNGTQSRSADTNRGETYGHLENPYARGGSFTVPSHFLSASHTYLQRLRGYEVPFIVRNASDFSRLLTAMADARPLAVQTLILPPGVSLSDPRLKHSTVRNGRTYELPLGDSFTLPDIPFIADIDGELVETSQVGPIPGEDTRIQVVAEAMVPPAVFDPFLSSIEAVELPTM